MYEFCRSNGVIFFRFLFKNCVNCRYVFLFDYFKEFLDVVFKVVADNYVIDDSGIGIVYCVLVFGEDDYRVCLENKIIKLVSLVFFFKS